MGVTNSMSVIPLNYIFRLVDADIKRSKIELNTRMGKGEPLFINTWLEYSDIDKEDGIRVIDDCSYFW